MECNLSCLVCFTWSTTWTIEISLVTKNVKNCKVTQCRETLPMLDLVLGPTLAQHACCACILTDLKMQKYLDRIAN